MLFNKIIFGPVKSRRLGTSLGVNLLPDDCKLCNFNCIYCECGFNFTKPDSHLPQRDELRNSICPTTKVSVLSNATLINKPKIFDALQKIDNNILKLDSGIEDTINLINQPVTKFSLEKTIENLRQFKGELTVQTLFFRGKYKGVEIDNTSDKEVAAWIEAIKKIKPKSVMIYTLDRPTPVKELYKADEQRLKEIATLVENLGIKTQING